MSSELNGREILLNLEEAVVNFDEEASVKICQQAVDSGLDPVKILESGLATGMQRAGDLFNSRKYFVPELLRCSDAFEAGLAILKPQITADVQKEKLRVIIGSMEGDLHDIGRKLVALMYEVAGWDVTDLGHNVRLERFLLEIAKSNSDVVALSSLMTSSMLKMPVFIKEIKEIKPDIVIMVGGAPMNLDIANDYGADGYADNCGAAVRETETAFARASKASSTKKKRL
jgi:methylmalonyl-CoA mutase cobalamin-binding domain/chain